MYNIVTIVAIAFATARSVAHQLLHCPVVQRPSLGDIVVKEISALFRETSEGHLTI